EMGLDRRPHGIGLVRPPRLPDRCDMVDVHAQLDHARQGTARGDGGQAGGRRRPRLTAACRGYTAMTAMSEFTHKLAQLKSDLTTQGDRVVDHTLRAVESYFESDPRKAATVIENDAVIDRVDVDIERA